MLKLTNKNLIVDICPKERFLYYNPAIKRFLTTKRYAANAVLGSDNDTVYHLFGTIYNFDEDLQTVMVETITEKEFKEIQASNYLMKQDPNSNLKQEVDDLKKMVAQQNELIQQLLQKLS